MTSPPTRVQKRRNTHGPTSEAPRLFECHLCSDYGLPATFRCRNGHLICPACKPTLSNCPTCRGQIQELKGEAFDDQPVDMSVKRFKRSKPMEVNRRRPSVIAFASNGLPRGTNASIKRRRTDILRSPVPITTVLDITPKLEWIGDGSTSVTVNVTASVDLGETFRPASANGKVQDEGRESPLTPSRQVIAPRKCSRTRVIIEEAKTTGEIQSFIDEHFRRSLGSEKFTDLFKKKPKSENNAPAPLTTANDDKGEEEENKDNDKEKEAPEDKKIEVEQASVDDHFAKALGSDYWLKLNKSIPKNSK